MVMSQQTRLVAMVGLWLLLTSGLTLASSPDAGLVLGKPHEIPLPGRSASLDGAVRDMVMSRDGRHAYVSMATDAGPLLQVLDLARHPATTGATVRGVPAGPLAVSPDGRRVYILGHRRTLTMVDVDDASPHVTAERALDGIFHDLALSADGALLYFGSDLGMDHDIHAYRTRDVTATDYSPDVHIDIESLKISPDGSLLAAVGNIDNQLVLVGTGEAGSQVRAWKSADHAFGAFAFSADGRAIYQGNDDPNGVVISRRDIDSGKVVAHSGVLPLATAKDLLTSPDGRHVYVAGATERKLFVLSAKDLAVEQQVHLSSSPAAALAVSARSDTYGTLYVAQGGDPADPDSRPVVAAYREIDPGPSQRPASVVSHPARTSWGVVALGGGVALLGAWGLVARQRRQSR